MYFEKKISRLEKFKKPPIQAHAWAGGGSGGGRLKGFLKIVSVPLDGVMGLHF